MAEPPLGSQYQEILSRLDRIENGGRAPLIPLIDPTANVLAKVGDAVARLDDLRNNDRTWRDRLDSQTEKWRDKFDNLERSAAARALELEAGRLNALLAANTSNVALALEKQSAQAQAQDRRLAALEQNQYQSGGANIQRIEARGQTNVDRNLLISVVAIIGAIAAAVIYHH